MVTVIFKEKNNKGEDIETTGHMPLSQVKNAVLGKNNKNKDFIDKYEEKANLRTEELHNSTNAETTGKYNPQESKKILTKKDIESRAKAAGYSYDEYYELVKDKVTIK